MTISLSQQWHVEFFNAAPRPALFLVGIDGVRMTKRLSKMLNRSPLPERESDWWFESYEGFCLVSWTCSDEESRSGVTLSWQTSSLSALLLAMTFSRRGSTSNCISLSEQTLFVIERHQPSNLSFSKFEHIQRQNNDTQVNRVRQRRNRRKRWSILAANVHQLDRIEPPL
jgi:hypothetical protein